MTPQWSRTNPLLHDLSIPSSSAAYPRDLADLTPHMLILMVGDSPYS